MELDSPFDGITNHLQRRMPRFFPVWLCCKLLRFNENEDVTTWCAPVAHDWIIFPFTLIPFLLSFSLSSSIPFIYFFFVFSRSWLIKWMPAGVASRSVSIYVPRGWSLKEGARAGFFFYCTIKGERVWRSTRSLISGSKILTCFFVLFALNLWWLRFCRNFM